MIGQARGHRRGAGPPPLGRARTIGGFGDQQGLAQTGVRQDKIVIDLEQRQLIPQTRFALTERIDPAPDRRHALADIEVEPLGRIPRDNG